MLMTAICRKFRNPKLTLDKKESILKNTHQKQLSPLCLRQTPLNCLYACLCRKMEEEDGVWIMEERMAWEIWTTTWSVLQIVNRLWRGFDHNMIVCSVLHHLLDPSLHAHWIFFISLLVIPCQRQSKHFKSSWGTELFFFVIYVVKNYRPQSKS